MVGIIGPLSTPNSSVKLYILTVIDKVIWYPEDIILSILRADKVIDALLGSFMKTGFLEAQFVSDLLQALIKSR